MKNLICALMVFLLIACGTPRNDRDVAGPTKENIIINPQVEDLQEIVVGLLARNRETQTTTVKIIKKLDQFNYENVVIAINKTLQSKLSEGMSYKSLVRVTTSQSDLCSYFAKKQVTVAALPEAYTLREYKRDLENTITDEREHCKDMKYQENILQVKWQAKNNTWAQFNNRLGFYLVKLNGKSAILSYEFAPGQIERVSVYDPSIPYYQNPALQVDRSLNPNIKMTAMTIIVPTTLDDLSGIDLTEVPVKDLR
jgi:hypothetical protein